MFGIVQPQIKAIIKVNRDEAVDSVDICAPPYFTRD